MGLFDRIFGRGATQTAQAQPNNENRFSELRDKYQTALTVADQQQIQFQNLHVQDDKLYIRGVAPSEDAKNAFWNQVKLIDGSYSDLTADISVDESRAQSSSNGGGQQQQQQQGSETYTVQPGDTLSKISRKYYNDADEYMRIFYANRDKLNDPDKIQVGQQLTIPPDDNA